MPVSFETLNRTLRWFPVDGASWQTNYQGCVCLVMRTEAEQEGFAPIIVCEGEIWLRAPELFNTLAGAQAWCLDKLTIL